jgi:hypothetical protein
LSPSDALAAVTWIIAAAVLLQTIELWVVRGAMADDGVWSWSALRRPGPARLGDRLFDARGVATTLALRGVAATIVPLLPTGPARAASLLVLCVTTVLVAVRWRGSFNGGSDAMTLHVLAAATVHALVPDSDTVARASAWYVAIVAVHSYALAGLAKVVHAPWRDGTALAAFVATAVHLPPPTLVHALARRSFARAAAWTVIAIELAAPVALLDPRACVGFAAVAAAFHIANAWVFGLSRFVLPWLATFPALYACAGLALS